MAQYSNLKAYIEEKIYENGTQAITGDILQDVLKVMTDDLGEFYQTGGVASPSTDPGTPDAKVIYFATEAGTYTNFGGITLAAGEVALLIFETSWTKETLNVLSSANGGVKNENLADGAVTTAKIANGAVEEGKIADASVTSGKLGSGAVTTEKIADGAATTDKLADKAVATGKLGDKAVTSGKIADKAVGTGQIADEAITEGKIADDAVTSGKLNDGAVTEDKIATDAVTSGKVKDGAIGTAKIAAGAVTHAKIGAGAVEESNIKDGAVTSDKIANGAVGSDQLAEGAFSAQNLADGSVTTDKLADDAVTAEKIADGAVTANKFANGSVTTIKLGSGAVTTEKIGDGMVTRQKLADSSVSTSKIIDGAVTTAKVADANVTTAKIADANVTTGKLADGAVTTAKIADGNVTGAKLQEGVRPVINVNALNEQTSAYGSAALARAAVPSALRILGLHVIYLLAGGWFEDEFIGSDVSGWGTASNWRAVGPVSVSQNTSTGHSEIHIGSDSYPVASVEEVELLKKYIPDIEETKDVTIKPQYVDIQIFDSSGVQKIWWNNFALDSAIIAGLYRITNLVSGSIISIQLATTQSQSSVTRSVEAINGKEAGEYFFVILQSDVEAGVEWIRIQTSESNAISLQYVENSSLRDNVNLLHENIEILGKKTPISLVIAATGVYWTPLGFKIPGAGTYFINGLTSKSISSISLAIAYGGTIIRKVYDLTYWENNLYSFDVTAQDISDGVTSLRIQVPSGVTPVLYYLDSNYINKVTDVEDYENIHITDHSEVLKIWYNTEDSQITKAGKYVIRGCFTTISSIKLCTAISSQSVVRDVTPYAGESTGEFFFDVLDSDITNDVKYVRIQIVDGMKITLFYQQKEVIGEVVETLQRKICGYIDLKGKKIAVIGDSISTIYNNNNPYFTVKTVDIGHQIQSYVTWWDIWTNENGTIPTNKTIGGVTLTSAMIGTLQTFTPATEDVGKGIGTPWNYNAATTKVWSENLCRKTGAILLANASWSGSRICGGQTGKWELSEAWNDFTIGCCKVRDDEGNDVIPDIIIIYRGTNDFSHDPISRINDVSLANGIPPTDYINSVYEYRAAYYKTIQKLREAYPKAYIVCCTLNVFKRMIYDVFPTRNSYYTLPQLNDVIRDIANTMSCGLIEFDKDGITFENCYTQGYITDSATIPTHPNSKGHEVMSERALHDITYCLNK